jgi:hypothetical protein
MLSHSSITIFHEDWCAWHGEWSFSEHSQVTSMIVKRISLLANRANPTVAWIPRISFPIPLLTLCETIARESGTSLEIVIGDLCPHWLSSEAKQSAKQIWHTWTEGMQSTLVFLQEKLWAFCLLAQGRLNLDFGMGTTLRSIWRGIQVRNRM